ncbi:MAG: hypothetical protein Fur006_57440 [Coleofasciculaceae cyanobacterium]
MNNLGKKRLEAVLAIASYAVGSGAATVAPNPGVEIPRQLVLTTSDILMYTVIWKIYFEEDLSQKGLLDMLAELGLVTVAATGTAYIVAKGSSAILHEITDWFGPVGWGVSAAIAGSLTGLFGMAWAMYCDNRYAQREAQSVNNPTTN